MKIVPAIEATPAARIGVCEPLLITCYIDRATPLVSYEHAPSLEGLLSWAVVHQATKGRMLPEIPTDSAYDLPLPLELAGTFEGLPVWACTPLFPVSRPLVRDTIVETKREQTGRWTATKSGKFTISPSSGRWRSRMIPRPALIGPVLKARCNGDMEAVATLLERVTHIGKRRASGGGLVRLWELERVSEPFQWVKDGRLTRSLPAGLEIELNIPRPKAATQLIGFSPPYWRRCQWREGWPAGTEVS